MPLNLIKLAVGAESVEDLQNWYRERLKQRRAAGEPAEIGHITRMVPKRTEVTEGGSLYWVIKGFVQVRMRLLEIRPFVDAEGIGRCRLILDQKLVETEWQPRRPFQGWRYLRQEDAPRDLKDSTERDMPAKLRAELAELGLL
jgi:hypothetical protein